VNEKDFREVAGEALDEARDKFEKTWIRSDLHMDAVNFALSLYAGIVMRLMRGLPDPDKEPSPATSTTATTAGPQTEKTDLQKPTETQS